MKYLHKTRNGQLIPLEELSDIHLSNIIRFIEKKAEEGITIQCGSFGMGKDFDYDMETIYGKDVKKLMNYKHYRKELKRRNNLPNNVLIWKWQKCDEVWESSAKMFRASIEWFEDAETSGYAGTIKIYDTTIWYKFVEEKERQKLKEQMEREIFKVYADFEKDMKGVAR